MTKQPLVNRRAFFRRAIGATVSLPFIAGVAGQPVEETQAVRGRLISLSVNGREIAPRSLWSLPEATTGSILQDMQVLALLS